MTTINKLRNELQKEISNYEENGLPADCPKLQRLRTDLKHLESSMYYDRYIQCVYLLDDALNVQLMPEMQFGDALKKPYPNSENWPAIVSTQSTVNDLPFSNHFAVHSYLDVYLTDDECIDIVKDYLEEQGNKRIRINDVLRHKSCKQ